MLLAAASAIPLRIPEVLQLAASHDFSLPDFFGWIARAPGSAPLNHLVQLPFVVARAPSRLASRLISVALAIAACYLFLRLVKRIPLDRPYLALLLFMLLPVHFELSFQAQPFEQALFLLVIATGCFLRLVFRPGLRRALVYGGCLTLLLYTDRYSFLPAIGYLLFLLRFINRAQEGRAIRYVLPATAAPVLLFLPYALWAHTQVNADWLVGPPALPSRFLFLRVVGSVAAETWAAYLLSGLLAIGVMAWMATSFRITSGGIGKRIRLFSLAGGVIGTVVLAAVLDLHLGVPFTSSQLLWSAPAMVLLVIAGFEWLTKRPELRPLAHGAAILLISVCAVADCQSLFSLSTGSHREDLQALAAAVPRQLDRDSCVVFVSERFSKTLFLMFEPELQKRECLDFFHARVVLASHPYVRPDQQGDAESYFRGLNFTETKRFPMGGGQIVIMQAK